MKRKETKAADTEAAETNAQPTEIQEEEKKKVWSIKEGELTMTEIGPVTIDLQAIISARARDIFPEGDERATFPRRMIALPDKVVGEGLEIDYPYAIFFLEKDLAEAQVKLDAMIKLGWAEIEAGGKILWLYAVQHSISRDSEKRLYKVELTYIFRAKMFPEKILEEVK